MPRLLEKNEPFPDPRTVGADGLVAVGGDLSVARLLSAYRAGIFPWEVAPITWWSPDPRAIIELESFHVGRGLKRTLRKAGLTVTYDQAFLEVMRGCATPTPGRRSTWIKPEMIAAYTALHRQGHAHSVECWQAESLVGGVYGVAIGGCFAGESMFHRVSNASKVALYHLVQHLRAGGFTLFDIQMVTAATRPLGAVLLPRTEYLARLEVARELPGRF